MVDVQTWEETLHPYRDLADSIRSISPFWLYIDTIFFAYDGMCLSALYPQRMENQNIKFIITTIIIG